MVFIITFWVSLFGIIGVLLFKFIELKQGFVIAKSIRLKIHIRVIHYKKRVISFLSRFSADKIKTLFLMFGKQFVCLFSKFTKFVDKKTQKLASKVSKKYEQHSSKDASEFLKKISSHKKNLDIESQKRNDSNF